jgi:hypothetical protein
MIALSPTASRHATAPQPELQSESERHGIAVESILRLGRASERVEHQHCAGRRGR